MEWIDRMTWKLVNSWEFDKSVKSNLSPIKITQSCIIDEDDVIDIIDDRLTDDRLDDYINEIEPEVKIFGFDYSPAIIIKNVDPYLYSELKNEYVSTLSDDIIYEKPTKPTSINELTQYFGIYWDGEQ